MCKTTYSLLSVTCSFHRSTQIAQDLLGNLQVYFIVIYQQEARFPKRTSRSQFRQRLFQPTM